MPTDRPFDGSGNKDDYYASSNRRAIAGFCVSGNQHLPDPTQIFELPEDDVTYIADQVRERLLPLVAALDHGDDKGEEPWQNRQPEPDRMLEGVCSEDRIAMRWLLEKHEKCPLEEEQFCQIPPQDINRLATEARAAILQACDESGIRTNRHQDPVDTARIAVWEAKQTGCTPPQRSTEKIPKPPKELPPNTIKVFSDPGQMRNFTDIVGLDHQRDLLKPILYRALYPDLIKSPPDHALLCGYYGTGKSMLAEAMAREVLERQEDAGRRVHFAHVYLANISFKWVGETTQNMNRLLDYLERLAPVIVFMDEIETMMIDPAQTQMHEESLRAQGVFQSRLSGISPLQGVIIIGATNKPDIMDGAFLRAGRFGRGIQVPMPGEDHLVRMMIKKAERLQVPLNVPEEHVRSVLQIHAYGEHCTLDQAFTGADIEQLVTIMDEQHLVRTVEKRRRRAVSRRMFDECYQALLEARQIRQAVTAGRLAEFAAHGPSCPATSAMRSATRDRQRP